MADPMLTKRMKKLAARQATAVFAGQQQPGDKGPKNSHSLPIAQRGIKTGFDTLDILNATITDVLEENISTSAANVVINATGKMLHVVELQMKYGRPRADLGGARDLQLLAIAPPVTTQ